MECVLDKTVYVSRCACVCMCVRNVYVVVGGGTLCRLCASSGEEEEQRRKRQKLISVRRIASITMKTSSDGSWR